jgi:NTE family protein
MEIAGHDDVLHGPGRRAAPEAAVAEARSGGMKVPASTVRRAVSSSLIWSLFVAMLAGCASLSVMDTVPLRTTQLEPVGSRQISADGYRLLALPEHRETPDMLVFLAFSGGGKRSAAFAYGALKGLRDVIVETRNGPRALLDQLDGISGVSGGSFTAAYYGLYRDKAFGRYERDFLYRDTESYIYGIYLLPWNWTWLFDPYVGTNDFMERVYDRTMFHGARFRDLHAKGRPVIGIGATDLSYGTPFLFTQEVFDILCSDLDEFPVARAVAASNGFPGLFSAITLTNRVANCGTRKPGWRRRIAEADLQNPFSRLGAQAAAIDRYLDPRRTKYVHLADGGISDNLGLRVAGSMILNLSQSPDEITSLGLDRLRRVLVISVDGQGAQDPTAAQRRTTGGLLALFGLVSGGQIDRYNFETFVTLNGELRELAKALRTARCARGRIIDGAPCGDVVVDLIHIALTNMPPGPEKDRLQAIPTGLTIERADIDLLVAAGQTAITHSAPLQEFLRSYPLPSTQLARAQTRATAGGSGR